MVIFLAALMGGCMSWRGEDGTRHTIVVGAAYLRETTSDPGGPNIVESQSAGLEVRGIGARPHLSLGIQQARTLRVPPNWTGVLTVQEHLGKQTIITSQHPKKP